MRLIDADAYIEEARSRIDMHDMYLPIHIKEMVLDELPTVDAVPVIRCKDCRFYAIEFLGANTEWHLCRRINCERLLNDFCSRAERKTMK